MKRVQPLTAGIVVIALAVSLLLFYFKASEPFATPQKTIGAMVSAASTGDLQKFAGTVTPAEFQDFVGHFGEGKYEQVRRVYQAAYDLADPRWEEYRHKAESFGRPLAQTPGERVWGDSRYE